MTQKSQEEKTIRDDYLDKSNYVRIIRFASTPELSKIKKNAVLVIASIVISGLLGFSIFQGMQLIPM